MRKIDLHMHTCFCDGKDTPEEMVLAAIEKGMEAIGICVHSHTPCDESYCGSPEGIRKFLRDMNCLKKNYGDRIQVLAGLEQDLYSDTDPEGFDYIIGSVHYIKSHDRFYPIDESEETFVSLAMEQFDGDYYKLAEAYYEEEASVLEVTKADFVGHLDLLTKFNEGGHLFDENNPRYLSAAVKCVDKLILHQKPFEINTGAMARGYRNTPYPSKALQELIRQKGGSFLLNSDAHGKENLLFAFERYGDEAEDAAYDRILQKS